MREILPAAMPLQSRLARDVQSGDFLAQEPDSGIPIQLVTGKHERPTAKPFQPTGLDVFMGQCRGDSEPSQALGVKRRSPGLGGLEFFDSIHRDDSKLV